ncbi:MAG: tRNA (adenosine(37)-N6)-dimethylallyltransferase MiaA [Prevotella sp.]|nr:tRNA (adenosine(37)-N6)-dimethylallyltransferase MiaA [Prevotella sp.]
MQRLITILGPTASGKTPLAVALARRMDGEILSADSRQVYRRMDIGTGKDLGDYAAGVDGKTVNHSGGGESVNHSGGGESVNHSGGVGYHLIDICEPGTKYNLFQYQQDFARAYEDIVSRGKQPILCGGTGLYIEAVLKGYQLSPVPQNPALRQQLEGKSLEELTQMLRELKERNGSHMHNTTDVDTAQRAIRAIEIEMAGGESVGAGGESGGVGGESSLVFGLDIPRELRREKITKRLKARLEEGMVEEVKGLLAEGIPAEDLIYYGLEYKYLTEYVIGRLSYDEMFRQLEIAIHQFAKRQMTWFRGMERRGFTIHWIDATLPMDEKVNAILEIVNRAKNK